MGVDCRITLNAPISDVASAIGLLLGCKKSYDPEHGWVKVEGVKLEPCDGSLGAELVRINVKPPTGQDRSILWHWEFGDKGEKGMMPRASAVNIAMGRALCKLFGGSFEAHDCGDAVVEVYPFPAILPNPYGGDNSVWYLRQARLSAIRPLTEDDINACKADAAY